MQRPARKLCSSPAITGIPVLAFAAKGGMLYSLGWDPAIRRWDVAAREQIPPPEGVHATSVVAALPDGRTLAYEDDSGAIRLVDAAGGAERNARARRDLVFPIDLLGGRPSPGRRRRLRRSRAGRRLGVARGQAASPLGLAEGTRSAFGSRMSRLRAGRNPIGRDGLPPIVGLPLGFDDRSAGRSPGPQPGL